MSSRDVFGIVLLRFQPIHGPGGVRANAGRKRTRFGPPTLAEFKSSVDKMAKQRAAAPAVAEAMRCWRTDRANKTARVVRARTRIPTSMLMHIHMHVYMLSHMLMHMQALGLGPDAPLDELRLRLQQQLEQRQQEQLPQQEERWQQHRQQQQERQ